MTRRGGSCGRHGAVRHGRRRHVMGAAAMTCCCKCGTPICAEHATWDADGEAWACSNAVLCARDARKG